jgi:hypothetical protein
MKQRKLVSNLSSQIFLSKERSLEALLKLKKERILQA